MSKIPLTTPARQSHLRERQLNTVKYKLKNSFQDSLSRFCICGTNEIEIICCHYLLDYSSCSTARLDLLNSIRNIESSILQKRHELKSSSTFW